MLGKNFKVNGNYETKVHKLLWKFSFMPICIQIIFLALSYSVSVMTTEHDKSNLKNPVGVGMKLIYPENIIFPKR